MTLYALKLASITRNRYSLTKSLVFILLMASGASLQAQSIILPPTPVSNVPPATAAQSSPTESRPPSFGAESPLQWGFVSFHPHFFYKFLYGDGLQSAPGKQVSSTINSFSPGILVNIGTHWTLDYTPTKTLYSEPTFKDTFDHSFRLLGDTTYENWALHFSQTYASTYTPLVETSEQTSEDRYETAVSAGYNVNDRVQLESILNYSARFTTLFPDARETTVGEHFHYQLTPQLDTSLRLDYGYVNMSLGTDMTYTRPGVQLNWKATDKTSFNLQAGYENRKFRSGGIDNMNSPTFGAAILFQPFTTTTLSLGANHGVSVTYFTNQVTRDTGWNISLQQRLLRHYYLNVAYSGQKSAYISTDSTSSTLRDDKNYVFDLRLSTILFQRATVALLYQNRHNDSTLAGYGFTSNQCGFELGYQF